MTSIAFAGLTAAGKTTHAQRLAADLGYDYVSATDILFEILRVPRDAHPWFNQAHAISAAREDGAVDAEPIPVRHTSVDTATRRPAPLQGDTPRDTRKRPA
jgi:dephospho-CoA kinase